MLFKHYWNALTIKITNLPACRVAYSQPEAPQALWAATAFVAEGSVAGLPATVPGATSP